MNNEQLQLSAEVIEAACGLHAQGLTVANSGNVSARFNEGLLITPSGVQYEMLSPKDLVYLDLDGNVLMGDLAPSSEWHFHCDIYRSKPSVNGIVHAHSPAATALSTLRKPIPSFHYMVALFSEENHPPYEIPCCHYETFGTQALSTAVLSALDGYRGCIMANHGMVATGDTLSKAFRLAQELESLCDQYSRALQFPGECHLLSDDQMAEAFQSFAGYGQRR